MRRFGLSETPSATKEWKPNSSAKPKQGGSSWFPSKIKQPPKKTRHLEGVPQKGNTIASATISDSWVIAGSSEKGATVALRLPPEPDAPPQPLWRPANASASYSSALVHDRRVYLVNKAGVAFALDLHTGAELWNHRTGECWASPVAAAGPTVINITVPGAKEFFEKETVRVVVENPRAVQSAAMAATKQNAGRREMTGLQLSPGLILS
jgi:outer membrane protein assembly factor BamB